MPEIKRPSKVSVDFSGVEVRKGGGSDHIPEGDYLVEVVDCVERNKRDDPSVKMLSWQFKVVEPAQFRGKTLYNITVLTRESLWALRSMLVDMLGEDKVPQRALEIPIGKIVQAKKKLGVTVEDDEYKGKLKSRVVGTFSLEDWKSRGATIATESDDDIDADSDDEEEVKTAAVSSSDDEDLDEIDVDDI